MGPNLPSGCLDIEKYETDGWYGASLKEMTDIFDKPIEQDDLLRTWLTVRILVHALKGSMEGGGCASSKK